MVSDAGLWGFASGLISYDTAEAAGAIDVVLHMQRRVACIFAFVRPPLRGAASLAELTRFALPAACFTLLPPHLQQLCLCSCNCSFSASTQFPQGISDLRRQAGHIHTRYQLVRRQQHRQSPTVMVPMQRRRTGLITRPRHRFTASSRFSGGRHSTALVERLQQALTHRFDLLITFCTTLWPGHGGKWQGRVGLGDRRQGGRGIRVLGASGEFSCMAGCFGMPGMCAFAGPAAPRRGREGSPGDTGGRDSNPVFPARREAGRWCRLPLVMLPDI